MIYLGMDSTFTKQMSCVRLVRMIDEKERRKVILLGLLITLLGAGIRIYNLGGDSLWYDEILTRATAHAGWRAALSLRDHPPLLYWLVTAVIRVLGESEWTLRLPSLLAGIVAIPLLMVVGCVSKRPSIGLWAAFFLAVSPFHLRYSQESRHYALLMCFSLASTLLLYLAMTRKQYCWWACFAIVTTVNLYTHYGAFMVLAAHLTVIVVWLASLFAQGKYALILQPLSAGLLLSLLYAPWLINLNKALGRNLGETAFNPGRITPLSQWLHDAYPAFGFNSAVLAPLILLLVIIGFMAWAKQRQWLLSVLILSLIGVPFLLITTLQVARAPLLKYIIYILPAYLLAAAAGIDAILQSLTRNRRIGYDRAAVMIATLFFVINVPNLLAEYRYMERDWRGAIAYLADVAEVGDLFVTINLDLTNGFNQGAFVAPFYLEQTFDDFTILDGNQLHPDQLQSLPDNATVWFLALDRHAPFPMSNAETAVNQFTGHLFLLHQQSPSTQSAQQMLALMQQLDVITTAPLPQCMVQEGVAALHFVQTDYEQANNTFDNARTNCPTLAANAIHWNELETNIQHGRIETFMQSGKQDKAMEIAQLLWQKNHNDNIALTTLTVENLVEAFQDGNVTLVEDNSPEPMQVRKFTMPHNGDFGDVIFMHPPSALIYQVTLPDEPTRLTFRIAMDPQSWEWGGDGSTFVVRLHSNDTVSVELFRQHINNLPENRRWHDVELSLAVYSGKQITLTLSTEAGPINDTIGDWAGWGTPRIMWQP